MTDAVVYLKGVEAVLANPKSVFDRCGELLRDDALRQFQAGGDPAWRPLSRYTIAKKRSFGKKPLDQRASGYVRMNRKGQIPKMLVQNGNFGPENILMRTGALLSSWTQTQDPDHIERINGDTLEFGSSVPYARIHQLGGSVPLFGNREKMVHIPARPIRITDAALAAMTKAAAEVVAGVDAG